MGYLSARYVHLNLHRKESFGKVNQWYGDNFGDNNLHLNIAT